MPIQVSRPPEGSLRALAEGLRQLGPNRTAFRTAAADAPRLGESAWREGRASRAFVADAGDLADGRLLAECAHFVGWRYLLPQLGAAAAEVEQEGERYELRVLNESMLNQHALSVSRTLSERDELRALEFELAFLTIPALYVVALWLRAEPDVLGYVAPITPDDRRFERGRLYPMPQFDEMLRTLALARVATPDPA